MARPIFRLRRGVPRLTDECWLERGADGKIYTVCSGTLLKGALGTFVPSVSAVLTFAAGVAAGYFGGGWLATRR